MTKTRRMVASGAGSTEGPRETGCRPEAGGTPATKEGFGRDRGASGGMV